ncbi:hypothetical protein J4E80_006928 [Alternaria sp. BMP 0032]|nr:hypothetical protein J4E80_006928 [Alternaria sp. BMP 0032]
MVPSEPSDRAPTPKQMRLQFSPEYPSLPKDGSGQLSQGQAQNRSPRKDNAPTGSGNFEADVKKSDATSSTQGAEDKTNQPLPVQNTAADMDDEDAENGGAQANDVQKEVVKVQQDQDDEASALVEDEEVPWGPHGLK